jgi:TonB family protein
VQTTTANEHDTSSSSWFPSAEQLPDSGEIDSHHSLLALLNRIYSGRLTGKLQLVFGRLEKQLFFDGGQVVFATSGDRQDSLGEMMLRAGALTQSQFEEASSLVKTGQRFGSAIAEMGVYGVEEIVTWVQRQLIQITASVLDYPAGRYYFFGSLEANVVPEIGIPVPLGKLLLEAVHKADDLPLDQLAEDADLRVDCSPDPLLLFQAVDLEKSERHLLGLISQSISAKEIVSLSGLPKAKAARALYALLLLGFVVDSKRPTRGSAIPISPPAPKVPRSGQSEKQSEQEIRRLIEVVQKGTYYDLLGVTAKPSPAQIQQSFDQLARKFHPDRHMGQSERVGLLQDLMARVTTAYTTLIDDEKRASYDKQLAATGAFALGESKTERQESVDECFTLAKKCLRAHDMEGSILWLRKCVAIVPAVAEYHAILARSLAGVPQYHQEAIQEFEKSIELDARNTSVYFQFAELYEAMRLPENAIGLYRKILEIHPEHSKARERLRETESALKGKRAEKDEKSVSLLSRLFHRKPAQPEFRSGPLAIPTQGTTELPSEEDMSLVTTSPSASSAKASADKSVELRAAPNVEEVQALKREVEALREQLKLKETPAASQRAPLPAAIPDAFPPLADGDVHGTESNSNSGSNEAPGVAVRGTSLPIEHNPVPTQLTVAEQVQFPKPPLVLPMSLPKSKWRPRAGRNFTPGFRRGVLRLALLTAALVVTVGGATWYEHWILSKSAAKKPSVRVFAIVDSRTSLPPGSGDAAKEHSEFSNTKVASDAPATSPGIPSQAAESPALPLESSGSVAQPAVRRTSPSTTLAAKRAVVRPTARATSDPIVASAAENVMIPPKLIKSVRAVASPDAVRDFETGNVVMDAVVGTDGEVHFITVLSGPPSLRAAAVEAVKQYRYEPATRNGQIVPAHVNITIHFRFES